MHSFSEAVHSELERHRSVGHVPLRLGFTRDRVRAGRGVPEHAASKLPGFTWMESDDVARQAVAGMLAGKRTVVPGRAQQGGVHQRALLFPRMVLLPLVQDGSPRTSLAASPLSQEYRLGGHDRAGRSAGSVNGLRLYVEEVGQRRADPVCARDRQFGAAVAGDALRLGASPSTVCDRLRPASGVGRQRAARRLITQARTQPGRARSTTRRRPPSVEGPRGRPRPWWIGR